jgi:hypothetical protein
MGGMMSLQRLLLFFALSFAASLAVLLASHSKWEVLNNPKIQMVETPIRKEPAVVHIPSSTLQDYIRTEVQRLAGTSGGSGGPVLGQDVSPWRTNAGFQGFANNPDSFVYLDHSRPPAVGRPHGTQGATVWNMRETATAHDQALADYEAGLRYAQSPQYADQACRERLRARGVVLPASKPCIELDKIVAGLEKQKIQFNKPTHGWLNETFRIVVALNTAPDQDSAPAFSGTRGIIQTRETLVAQYMSAKLSGVDFKVEPSGERRQAITSTGPVIWEWEITPTKEGVKQLVLDLTANLLLNDVDSPVRLPSLRESIEIRVTRLQWFKSAASEYLGYAAALATVMSGVFAGFTYMSRNQEPVSKTKAAARTRGRKDV